MKLKACWLWIKVIAISFSAPWLIAKPPAVGIVYPDMREPYRSVFRNIVNGVREAKAFRTLKYPLGKEEELADVIEWLESKNIDVVVALGSRGLEMAKEFPEAIKVIFGGVLIPPESFPREAKGIILTPDPEILFTSLEKLTAKVNRIAVVYNPDHFEWLITLAKEAAATFELKLQTFPVTNYRDAASQYRNFFDHYGAETDAIWLLQDPSIIDERTILQLILEEAWKKKIVVFSSNPSYVKRGILFSLYPDNKNMGRRLAGIVRAVIENKENKYPPISPVADLLTAVNLRTAEHLGLKLSKSQTKKFSLVFPTR